jgi:diguanylate cyclase (GGDEF)-like protein
MRILIAEDQPTAALLLRHNLEKMGHEAVVAPDGEVAWQIVRKGGTPLLISDWTMPHLDGLELCRRIRATKCDLYTYIILLTSRDRKEDKLEGLRAGADDFLIKPPDQEELAIRLQISERILAVHEQLASQNERLSELATTDELTGLKNRRRFREDLEMFALLAARQRTPLSLVMLDVDHFKQYNDTFGHPAGDEILRAVAAVLREGVRQHDVVARFGGEEFAVLLPGTDAVPAARLADRLRSAIERGAGVPRAVTASFGVATSAPETLGAAKLVDQADDALYRAKRSGRNCVCHFCDAIEGMTDTQGLGTVV